MHVFITHLRPRNTRHLNALYLPQFLSHLSLKTSHTPTFKPTVCCSAPCRPLLLWYHWTVSSRGVDGGVEPLYSVKVGPPSRQFSGLRVRAEVRGERGRQCQLCWTSIEGRRALQLRKSRRRKVNGHIWRYHGGSLENQLSGIKNCIADSIKMFDLVVGSYATLEVKETLKNYITMVTAKLTG